MTIQEILKKCGDITSTPISDSYLFGEYPITDPDTGASITAYGYSINDNQELIEYMGGLFSPLSNLHICLDDLLFFESILSVDNAPIFKNKTDDARYLKINYQNWIIKTITIHDCVLSALNSVFDLGLTSKTILTTKENIHIKKNERLTSYLKRLEKILNQNLTGIKSQNKQTKLWNVRNKIIHNNEFEHTEIDSLNLHAFFMQFEAIDMTVGDFNGAISSLTDQILDTIQKVNTGIITTVYEILILIDQEYKKKFAEKLVTTK